MTFKNSEKRIIELYSTGVALAKIRKETDKTDAEIYRVLNQHNVELRGGRKITKETEDKIITLYNNNTSLKDILLDGSIGVKSYQTIYRILERRGIEKKQNIQ